MPFVGEKTKKIVKLHQNGMSVDEIAALYAISPSSVEKRIKSFKNMQTGTHHTASEPTWTLENIKQGFDRFIKENGRLPTAPEIDKANDLPSSRQIQRRFGGLKNLRAELKYEEVDFGRGSFRTGIAFRTGERGVKAERDLERYLIEHFGEVYVHTEKRYGLKGQRVDFIVFSPDGNFGIDVFYTETFRDMQKNINIKVDKYIDFPKNVRLFFAIANPDFNQNDIDHHCRNMSKLSLLPDVTVVSLDTLYRYVSDKGRFTDPPNYQQIAQS